MSKCSLLKIIPRVLSVKLVLNNENDRFFKNWVRKKSSDFIIHTESINRFVRDRSFMAQSILLRSC